MLPLVAAAFARHGVEQSQHLGIPHCTLNETSKFGVALMDGVMVQGGVGALFCEEIPEAMV